MSVVGANHSKNVVSLEELVPQHDCLKLLILHTPYTLVIESLSLCVNLVKLDLSKNNLQSFPHLGKLTSLKFMFIHENRLDIGALKGIFQLNGKKSLLSQCIVWVTFWGNRNAFIGRHYLANETSAIAIDRNMIVQQERSPNFPFRSAEPFSALTDISHLLERKNTPARFASEEEYMRQLWQEMRQLRRLHQLLFPIIKVQKAFRGWMLRQKSLRANNTKNESSQVLKSFFSGWKQQARRSAKLKRILKQKGKDYLLLNLKDMRKQEKISKMISMAREIKQKCFLRKHGLVNELRIAKVFRQNYLLLKNLYSLLAVPQSSAVYIHKNHWSHFTTYVVPFLEKVSKEPVQWSPNTEFGLNLLYQFFSESTQFIKMMQTNAKSIAYFNKSTHLKKNRKPYLYGCNLKPVHGSIHISTAKTMELRQIEEKIEGRKVVELAELIKVQGSQRLLKHVVRGVYFFNTGILQGNKGERIHLFTEYALKRIASVTKIQKVWRGFSFRKKNEINLKTLLKLQRAAIIIQRWVRKLPNYRKKNFMYTAAKMLESIKDSTFYVETGEYITFLRSKQAKAQGSLFQQVDSMVYMHSQSNVLSLSWNCQSQLQQTLDNIDKKKWLFTKSFLKNKVGLTDQQITVKTIYDSEKHISASYSHIFHYATVPNLLTKANKSYLQVICPSRQQAKFRIFALLLCSYQPDKGSRLKIYDSTHFRSRQAATRKEIGKDQVNFICNQNFSLVKLCQTRFQNEPKASLHIISNRFYFQAQQKPYKAEERFFIYTYDSSRAAQEENEQKNLVVQRMKTEQNRTIPSELRFLTENVVESQAQQTEQPNRMRIMLKKRSVKQYKIDKKGKGKKQTYPNFVLDSMSINDRLTTQPDAILTQVSNQQNTNDNNRETFLEQNQVHKEQMKLKQRLTYIDKRHNSFKRKEEESFTKRFVNLGNFIQNQYANDYRRRIKTELECRAADSADHVRRELERSHSQKLQEQQQKQKRIREKHSQHKELIEKTQSLMREHSLQIKNGVIETKEKKLKERAKLKRLKVSFAEQCYPLASRHKRQEHFP